VEPPASILTTPPDPVTDSAVPAASLVDLLTPAWEQLLVRRDLHSNTIGVGLGGRPLVAPDTATDIQPCRTGTVLKAGPDALAQYPPGTRVAFGSFAMMVLGFDSRAPGDGDDGGEVGLVASTEVLCTFASEATAEVLPSPLSLDGAKYARAPVGRLLVERSLTPVKRGRIIVPGGVVGSIRSLEATVIDRHEQVTHRCPFHPGDVVLLGTSVGRAVKFGIRGDRVLWAALPGQLLCHMADDGTHLGGVVDDRDETPRAYRGAMRLDRSPAVFDEGDPRGPR
jgi:hypothetical protein